MPTFVGIGAAGRGVLCGMTRPALRLGFLPSIYYVPYRI